MDEIFSFNSAYLIQFKKLNNASNLPEHFPDLALFLSESGKKFAIEEDENGYDIMVLFIDGVKLQPIVEFCTKEEIILEHCDITDKLIIGQELPEVVDKMVESDEYKMLFNQFFDKNLSVDIVLDKISKYGQDSLSTVDKQVLANG